MRRKLSVLLVPLGMLVMGACSGGDGGGEETVSATEYATDVCGAISGWIDDIQGLNQDCRPTSTRRASTP